MKRAKSKLVAKRNEAYLVSIKQIKSEHPLWGYRRVWAYIRFRQGIEVNKKRIYRLMKEHDLLVTKEKKNKAKRTPQHAKPRAKYPNHYWGIDMTKIKVSSWGWVYLVVVLDWYTKQIVGYSLSMQSKTDDWLDALHQAVNNRYPKGIKDSMASQLYLVSDNGC